MEPCHFIVFDVLETGREDLRPRPLSERRKVLEDLVASAPATSLVVVSMHTADFDEARLWFEVLPARGIEGLMVKSAGEPYQSGRRRWWKGKHRAEFFDGRVDFGTWSSPAAHWTSLKRAAFAREVSLLKPAGRSRKVCSCPRNGDSPGDSRYFAGDGTSSR